MPLRPTAQLGPSVNTDSDHGDYGKVVPIRWNPLEGSSNGPAQVSICGNTDFQSMLRTLVDGFTKFGVPDRLRDPVLTDAEAANIERQEDEQFEDTRPLRVKAL